MKRQVFYILFFIPLFTACLESPEMTTGIVNEKVTPTVVTLSGDSIPSDGHLLFQGKITSDGKSETIEKGFCWSTVSNKPDINDNNIVVSGVTSGDFTFELKGAVGGKTYYWRAFAQNGYGYDYGEVRSCQTPPIWETKRSYNANARGSGVIFLQNEKIYITCGELDGGRVLVNTTWEYSIAGNEWNEVTLSFPGVDRINPVAFTIDNNTFIGTGLSPGPVVCKDFYLFTPQISTKMWTEIITPSEFEARYKAVAFSLNEKGFVIGGSSSGRHLNDMWQYTYSTDGGSWKKMNDFPVSIYGGISISGNGRTFAGFGETPDSEKILWEYNEAVDEWNEFAHLPDLVSKKIYSGVIIQNAIYIVDGDNQIWTLNLTDKSWSEGKKYLPKEFLNEFGEGGFQTLLTTNNSNSIYIGLGFTKLLYEYRPLWDN